MKIVPVKKKIKDKKPLKELELENEFEYDGCDFDELKSMDKESDEDGKQRGEKFLQFNEKLKFGEVHFELGMEFQNLEVLKTSCKDYNINLMIRMMIEM